MALTLETARYIKRTSNLPHKIVEVLQHDENCLGGDASVFGVPTPTCRCTPKRVGWTLVLETTRKKY
jgi:hypothetical protein